MPTRTAEDVKRDPQPGDVTKIGSTRYYIKSAIHSDWLSVDVCVGLVWMNSSRRMTLEEWQELVKEAEVTDIAQEAECK